MIRAVSVFLVWLALLFAAPAIAQPTQAQLTAQVAAQFPTGQLGGFTMAELYYVLHNIASVILPAPSTIDSSIDSTLATVSDSPTALRTILHTMVATKGLSSALDTEINLYLADSKISEIPAANLRTVLNDLVNAIFAQTIFTPLHLYFMSTTGNDANDGLGPSNAHAWATPNHNVVCGDVILVAAGDYSTINLGVMGTVSSCPSTSGGIDGTGGIYFATLLCSGADLEACTSVGTSLIHPIVNMGNNNWSVQGWKLSFPGCSVGGGCGAEGRAFNLDGGSGGPVHHFALINNVCVDVASCVHTDDAGATGSHGVDYVAAVGNIGAQASMNNSTPEAAFDIVGPFPLDQNAGTHYYLYNNYTWNDNAGTVIDSEAYMFDAWDFHAGNNNTGVIANNISWNAQRFCVNLFENEDGQSHTITPTMKVYNNTCFHNGVAPTAGDNVVAELAPQIGLSWTALIHDNIAYQDTASSGPNPTPLYAASSYGGANFPSGTNSGLVWGSGANQNILKGSATTCAGNCDAGKNAVAFDANTVPTGIFVNPGFNNTTDLLTNRSGNTPNCTGFINTTLCLGWNANTQTLTNPSVIYDLQPNPNCGSVSNQCLGKGFQLPSTTCASSGDVFNDYPVWLKGVGGGLHWDGTQITEMSGLATRKCGL